MTEKKDDSSTEPIFAVVIDAGYQDRRENWPNEALEVTLGKGVFDFHLINVSSGPDWESVREAFETEAMAGHDPMLVTRVPTKTILSVFTKLNLGEDPTEVPE